MTKRIKQFDFCTCVISLDVRRKLLFVDYLKKGQVFYTLTITNFKKDILKDFLVDFDEKHAKDTFLNNIEYL
jgi:hypothetical protein